MNSNLVHPAARPTGQLLQECQVRRLRRSGPGGQRRNKVETAVLIRHRPTGIEAEANERRSQAENQRMALRRLRIKLALDVRASVDPESVPSGLWQRRCGDGRITVSVVHSDFPAILSEALDILWDERMHLKAAADHLGCTSSQLTKLLKVEPRAFAQLNAKRKEMGLRPLI